MKNKKKIIIAITIIFTIIICILFYVFASNKKVLPDIDNDTINSKSDYDIGLDIDKSINEKELKNIISYMNSFDSIAFVKIVSKEIYNDDSTSEFSQSQYIISEIDTIKGKDNTIDYLNTSKTYEEEVDFEKTFGFDIKNCNDVFSFVNALTEAQGFNNEYTEASLDSALYKYTGQKSYILENDSKILQKMIEEIDYDEILDTYCYFTIKDSVRGDSYINCITAQVTYKYNNVVMSNNLDFIIQVYNQDGSNHPDGDIEY